jgi:Ser-tRNA(Ala) deacylase AlaX
MSTLPAYERDPYLTELETRVQSAGNDGRPYVLLEDTILCPEGGGQPSDRGTLDGVAVLDVQRRDGEVRHYLAAPAAPGPARLRLDWTRRWDHMQQHTGQHLLTAVAQDRFAWATTAFHLGEEVSDIELATPGLASRDLARLEEAVAAEIRAARPIHARRVTPEAYADLKVRSRGLPEGFQGDVRLVTIEGVDVNTCGGTHVRGTAELESMKLLGTESIRGGTRLFFVAGARLRRRLEGHEHRNAALRGLLGAPDANLARVLEERLEQARAQERRVRALEEELAEGLAAALAARPGGLVQAHLEGKDAGFLQKLGRQVVALDPAKTLFLTTSREDQHLFLLCAGEAAVTDVPARGREIAGILGGRGGGSGRQFQGKAPDLAARARALEALA